MWEYTTEDHAIAYTEVYVRLVNPNLATLAYTENDAPRAVLPTIVLNDADNTLDHGVSSDLDESRHRNQFRRASQEKEQARRSRCEDF